MSKKNSNNIKKSTVSSGNKFSDDSVINEMDVLPSTKSIKMPIKFNVDFDPLIGYVNSEVTLAMSPDSTGLFTIGNNVDKYTGISKEETKEAVESGMETPDDAVIYGMCNVMNNGDDIFFWTNGTRLAGAADKVGVLSGINELLTHECLHLTRTILNKHILKNKGIVKWAESDWLSIGDQDDDIQEESFATALGLITEQVTPKFIEMASEYIPELKNSTLPKAQEGLDFQSRLNQFLKPSTFSPNILGRSSGRSNVGYEYKAGPFTQSTMFASDRRLAPVDKFTFASDNPTNTQLSLNTGLNYKDKYGFKGAASYANTTAKNDPNAKFNVGYDRKGLTADYNYNYNKENPSYNLNAGYRGQGVTADFKMSKDKYNISFDNEGNVIKTPIKTPTYNTNVGYELDGVSGKFGFTGNKETPKYTFGVGYDKKGVTGEFTATKDQKKPFVYNANLGYNKDGFSTGLEFSGNKENPNYTYRVKYEPEKQGFTTDSNLEFTKGNIDATTGLGYKNKNINTGLSYKTSIDRENESQQNSLGANFGYRNKNFNTGINYERRFATEENPASNKIGVNVGYKNKSGIGVNAGVDYKTLSEDQKKLEKASPFEFRAGVTYTPQRKRQQTPTKKFTFSKEDVKKEPIDIKDLPEFKKKFGGQHIYHDLFQKGGRKTKNGITILNPIEEATYQDWRKSLPSNLQNDTSGYDLRGAWATGIQPELFYYDEQGKFQSAHPINVNEPGSIYQPHLFSIDPDTGRYLKSPTHDTYLHAIEGDIKAGYTPYMNVKTGHMYVKPSKKKQGGTVINESDVIAQNGIDIFKLTNNPIGSKPRTIKIPHEQTADHPKMIPLLPPPYLRKAETTPSSNYSKYLNLTPEDVLDKYSFDEYSKAFGLDPVTMRNQINKSIKWDKISNLGEFDTEKFLTRKLYDYIQDNPPKAQKGLNKERKYGLSESDKQRILKEAERTKYQLTKPNGFMTNNPNWYKNSDLLEENIAEFFDPTGITSHDDAYKAYKEWKTSGNTLPNSNQALDMFGAVPALGKFGKLKYISNITDINNQSPYVKEFIKPIYKYFPWQQVLNFNDTVEDLDKDNIRPTKQHGGLIHESDVVTAQDGKTIKIDNKEYKINSPEYRKLYYDDSIASVDQEGVPTFYKDESIWDDYLKEQRKNKVANAVREGTGKFARGVMSGANYAGEVMGTPAALALEVLSGRRDFQSALPNIDRSNKMFGLPYSKENLPSNEQLSPSSALGITNPYLSIPIDLAADYATGKILSNPKKYVKAIKPVPFDSPNYVYNTDINTPAQRYQTYRWSEKNPETNWYDVYEKEFPIDLIPTRDPISDPYQKIKMKSILRRDEGVMWPIIDYLRTKKLLPRGNWNISDVLSDPITGLLQDGNTRYWLNKRYDPTSGLNGNKYKIENRISNLRKNNFEDLKPLYSTDEPIKSQWINKKSGGTIINESDVIKYKSGGNHGGLDRWFAEKWVDVKTGKECGRQEGEKRKSYPACRPSVRVTNKTPKTASELSSAEKEKFKRSKTSSQRINYQHKRNK